MTEASVRTDAPSAGSLPESSAGNVIEKPGDPVEYLGNLDAGEKTAPAKQEEADPEDAPGTKSEEPDTATVEENVAEPAAEEDAADEPEDGDKLSDRVQKRISKLTARWHEAEEKSEQASKRVSELEAQASASVGVHPMFLSADEAKAIRRVNELESEQERLFTRLDGYEDEQDPEKSMTAEQVRREYIRVQREVSELKPKAVLAYDRAMAEQTEALRLGREALLLKKQGKKVPATAKPGVVKPIPKLPVAPSVAPGSAALAKHGGPSEERFKSAGRSEEALHAELSRL